MRAFDVSSLTTVRPEVQLSIAGRDGVTYVHCLDSLVQMSPLSWELKPGGGFAAPGYYSVEVSLPLAELKGRLSAYYRAEARLNVTINSADNTFQPHVGRITDLKRGGDDPNLLRMTVVDRFLHDNPLIPRESLVDSWSAVHPEDLESGYPLYYGQHHRPFYFTAVDCAVGTLLGPRNVNSEGHTGLPLYRSKAAEASFNPTSLAIECFATGFNWSPVDNLAVSSFDFHIVSNSGYLPAAYFTGGIQGYLGAAFGILGVHDKTKMNWSGVVSDGGPFEKTSISLFPWKPSMDDLVKRVVRMYGHTKSQFFNTVSGGSIATVQLHTPGGHFYSPPMTADSVYSTDVIVGSFDALWGVTYMDSHGATEWLKPWDSTFFWGWARGSASSTTSYEPSYVASMDVFAEVSLYSGGYKAYSLFAYPTNSADLAVSNDPGTILADLLDNHSDYSRLSATWSTHATSGHDFNCLFHERQPLSEILDEFGVLTGRHLWLGDSGTARMTQDVGLWTNSPAATLTPDDYLSFSLHEGGVADDAKLYKDLQFNYAYDHQQRQHAESRKRTDAYSAAAAVGFSASLVMGTRHVVSSAGAEAVMDALDQTLARPIDRVQLSVPLNWAHLEPGDLINVQNPMLVGSEAVFQITKYDMDVLGAGVLMLEASRRNDL